MRKSVVAFFKKNYCTLSYLNFNIRKEYKFLRNFLTEKQVKESQVLKSFVAYDDAFERFF